MLNFHGYVLIEIVIDIKSWPSLSKQLLAQNSENRKIKIVFVCMLLYLTGIFYYLN